MAGIGFVAPQKPHITFAVDPVRNVLTSMLLLSEDVSGLGGWIEHTLATLDPAILETHHRLIKFAVGQLQGEDWPSFPAWLDDLATRDPHAMVYAEVSNTIKHVRQKMGDDFDPSFTTERLLADRDVYLEFQQTACDYFGYECELDRYADEHAMFSDPPARLQQVISHLRMMWDEYLTAEWERNLPLIQDSIAAFESLNLNRLTTAQAVHRVIERDEPQQWGAWRDNLQEIIFIPSAHVGPYLLMIEDSPTQAWIVFGARTPEGATVQSPILRRSDLLVRLSALADDTRLRILAMLADGNELETRSIQDELDLSKSAASRHLRQLTAGGYVIVRQQEKSNYYRLNPERFTDTWHALKVFLQL